MKKELTKEHLDKIHWPSHQVRYDFQMRSIVRFIDELVRDEGLDIDPDFQRGHVWTEFQQVKWIEHVLMGGKSGKELCIAFSGSDFAARRANICLLDGKQRLEAVRIFLRDGFRVFSSIDPDGTGYLYSDIAWVTERVQSWLGLSFFGLGSRADIVDLYIRMNSGGSVHSEEDISRAKAIYAAETEKARHS